MKKFFISNFTKVLIIIAAVLWSAIPLSYSTVIPKIGFSKSFSAGSKVNAYAAEVRYGLIGEDAMLLDSDFQPLTGLPSTYFVIIITESDQYYSVQYSDLTGFIDKSKIVPIDYEPKIKFGTAYFIADNDTHSVNVRALPKTDSAVLASIPDGESAFYYGGITGDALISAAGSLWYYVRLNNEQRGYVYSAQGSAGIFQVNSGERVETFSENNGDEAGGGGTSFPDWGFILLLAVPAIIITLALFARKPAKEDRHYR